MRRLRERDFKKGCFVCPNEFGSRVSSMPLVLRLLASLCSQRAVRFVRRAKTSPKMDLQPACLELSFGVLICLFLFVSTGPSSCHISPRLKEDSFHIQTVLHFFFQFCVFLPFPLFPSWFPAIRFLRFLAFCWCPLN